jgi:NAD+ synthase
MDAEQLTRQLTAWIKEKVSEAGCNGVTLGMSGGIDSSVLAVICQRAFPKNTLGIIMPCYSDPQDKSHAEELAEKFGIQTRDVILDGAFDTLLEALPAYNPNPEISRAARANLKARLRMITLYYTAQKLNYLVAGSSNRCEITIGYFSKHGDGGVDIMPLGNLVKGNIRELAVYLDIPRVIIDKPPSAGLWAGQTDEEEIGLSYDILDSYILTGEAPEDAKSRIETMIAASKHKRSLPPVAVFQQQ